MPRGICWDELPNRYYSSSSPQVSKKNTKVEPKEEENKPHEFDLIKDGEAIGRRVAFGVVCGGLTGAGFGFFEVLRDPKMFATKRQEGTSKIMRFTARFAAFFGAYNGLRKTFRLLVPQGAPEENLAVAAILTITPLVVVPSLRPMAPYGVMMVALDAFNGINDV